MTRKIPMTNARVKRVERSRHFFLLLFSSSASMGSKSISVLVMEDGFNQLSILSVKDEDTGSMEYGLLGS